VAFLCLPFSTVIYAKRLLTKNTILMISWSVFFSPSFQSATLHAFLRYWSSHGPSYDNQSCVLLQRLVSYNVSPHHTYRKYQTAHMLFIHTYTLYSQRSLLEEVGTDSPWFFYSDYGFVSQINIISVEQKLAGLTHFQFVLVFMDIFNRTFSSEVQKKWQ
jgi:hypothetical protein